MKHPRITRVIQDCQSRELISEKQEKTVSPRDNILCQSMRLTTTIGPIGIEVLCAGGDPQPEQNHRQLDRLSATQVIGDCNTDRLAEGRPTDPQQD